MSPPEHQGAAAEIRQPSDEAGGAAAFYEAGLSHLQAGRPLDAQACCHQALALTADHAGSLYLMGLLTLQARHYDHAVEWFSRAIRSDVKPLYLTSLGVALLGLRRVEEALQVFDKAVQLEPGNGELWRHLGLALAEAGRHDDALLTFGHALQIDPCDWDAAFQSGVALLALKRFDDAIPHFELCEQLRPHHALAREAHAAALQNLAVLLHNHRRFDEALDRSHRAYALHPQSSEACNTLAASLQYLRREEEALPWFDKAIDLKPDNFAALYNRGRVLRDMRRFDEAIANCLCMTEIGADRFLGYRGIEHIHLLRGDFEQGWAWREAQWKARVRPKYYPAFDEPIWLGDEPVEGRTLLVYADEGLGDTLHFVRYVPMVAARGARIILVADNPLQPLLSRLPGVWKCISKSEFAAARPAFDWHAPVCGLPLAFPRTIDAIPAAVPYLPLPASDLVQAWEDRLGPRRRLRVGLVWSGNPVHDNDHNRSIPLQMFADVLGADCTFISLKKDPNAADVPALKQSNILDFTTLLTDFDQTAALICCLDLVITVDTSIAHLAGGLGRATWIVLPYTPDFRWMLDREDSPWYPTARLFRQDETRDYGHVLARVSEELRTLIAASPAS